MATKKKSKKQNAESKSDTYSNSFQKREPVRDKMFPHVVNLETPVNSDISEENLPQLKESDFEPFSECGLNLTKSQIAALINMAYFRSLLMAKENKWSSAEEAAFFNGVMCVFFATQSQTYIPGPWLMSDKRIHELLRKWKKDGKLNQPI